MFRSIMFYRNIISQLNLPQTLSELRDVITGRIKSKAQSAAEDKEKRDMEAAKRVDTEENWKALEDMVRKHDKYFDRSDDYSVYSRGQREYDVIASLAQKLRHINPERVRAIMAKM